MSDPTPVPDPFDFAELGRLLTARAVAHRLSGQPGLPSELLMAADLLHSLRSPNVMTYQMGEYYSDSGSFDSHDGSTDDSTEDADEAALGHARGQYQFKERHFHFKIITNETLLPQRP